ncbi:energy-coupling factor ABC transporter ATP-binding protein [Clostridium butyricum]|uniref:energy-coupling factor ABC transporter ATP-binding protein n=1 Tax=Clostridium TaxID=1485 RepID=UPI00071E9E0D|nr:MULTISPECIES: energy-coupling factor ABC transporter ATP-binding protein [Clostridium]ALR90292.1 cobalt ABC transporter ATP-binding protein [Clostridium butyricum]ALS19178.1 cobalt ABC transporter ATP-binding protein [Clostridium butyricum]ANF16364.1 cobalt ABC transporter ATP-binding protein [Clostridium butyricum]AOR96278.1 cobalt ABC transporter ATP-binding protein [Clostridium butyricum]MCI3010170.1 energy-coupling factor ABC transporter ATP-binding protein [Clostridium butyricum]
MCRINIEHMNFYYGRNKILDDINIKISENESVGLIGANGVGKSTLLKLMVGLLDHYEGEILINEKKLVKENFPDIRKETGYVFQDSDSQLFMSTVYEDVAFGPRNYGYDEKEIEKRVENALKSVNIEKLKTRQIYRMSGGEKKLASIAVILAMEPEIILLDEPSVALDPRNRRNLINILNKMNKLKIIASHDLDMIMDTCSRTILLCDGKIIKDGNTKDILTNKVLLEENGLELPLSLYNK